MLMKIVMQKNEMKKISAMMCANDLANLSLLREHVQYNSLLKSQIKDK